MTHAIRTAIRTVAARTMLMRERWESGVAYNPLSSGTVQNPYPLYAALRERDPVHRSRLMHAWVFTRHADVDAILRDHRRFSNDPRKGNLTRQQRVQLPPDDGLSMLFLDPPDHKRLRGLVNKAFTPRAVNALEPHIRSLLGELLDDIDDPTGFDLMEAVAQPLPVTVIAEMLGVPPKDRAQFKIWSEQRARLLEPTIDDSDRAVAEATSEAFDGYFRPIIKECRVAPQDNIVSALVRAEEEGNQLTERETLNMLRLLLIAGNETTTNMIGNSMLALLRHPDRLQQLRENPSLVPAAVEELLRFDSPVQMSMRRVLEDCEVNGLGLIYLSALGIQFWHHAFPNEIRSGAQGKNPSPENVQGGIVVPVHSKSAGPAPEGFAPSWIVAGAAPVAVLRGICGIHFYELPTGPFCLVLELIPQKPP